MKTTSRTCPNPGCLFHQQAGGIFHKKGHFKVKRLNRTFRRYRCKACGKTFSSRTFRPDYRQKKSDLNSTLSQLLCDGYSLRASSRLLRMTYKNTYQKYLWLIKQAKIQKRHLKFKPFRILQFDEMETIHHTKCKPLSICLMVSDEYQILEAKVSEMPCHGKLAAISRKRYGMRSDDREKIMEEAFLEVKNKLSRLPEKILSDAKPGYRKFVKSHFPNIPYETYSRKEKDRYRDRIHEKKSRPFDPIFSLNQRCAKLRSDIKRLVRRSWCTTKKIENLQGHLDLYIVKQFNF